MKIKKGDQVLIITGKDKGKRGVVEKSMPTDNKVVVSGINITKRHKKPSRKNPYGGIVEMPAPVNVSNVIVVCPHCGRPTRAAHKIGANAKERICRSCQGNLDTTASEKHGVKEKNVKA